MSAKLPYLTTPGTVTTALDKIKAAATPPTFTHDFVQTKLKIKGGTGRAIVPFLKKVGFVAGDGSPTGVYQRFRNDTTSGTAAAEALKAGYKPLYEVNEYAHDLGDKELKGLIVQVTGLEESSSVVAFIHSTFKKLKSFADFEAAGTVPEQAKPKTVVPEVGVASAGNELGFNISYTINLNLPPTTNIEVFNAIFKSLKENLLRGD